MNPSPHASSLSSPSSPGRDLVRRVQNLLADAPEEPRLVAEDLRRRLEANDRWLPLRAEIHLTKTRRSWTEALLMRDHDLEAEVSAWLEQRGGYDEFLARYRRYDPSMASSEWPRHYPFRILAGHGSISGGSNIFVFFPQALGLEPRGEADVFGFEFVDVWSNLFHETVFPCLRRAFDLTTQLEALTTLGASLDRTVYLAAVFHEIGHRSGFWKVSPAAHPELKISSFHRDVLGELATDSLLVKHLEEFPVLVYFVVFQRLFWFGRRGFKDDPRSALSNEDNDAWIGAYLWNSLRASGAIVATNGAWRLDAKRARASFGQIVDELDELGRRALSVGGAGQDEILSAWMKSRVPFVEGRGFHLPAELAEIFERCHDIVETPHFRPLVNLASFKQHGEIA